MPPAHSLLPTLRRSGSSSAPCPTARPWRRRSSSHRRPRRPSEAWASPVAPARPSIEPSCWRHGKGAHTCRQALGPPDVRAVTAPPPGRPAPGQRVACRAILEEAARGADRAGDAAQEPAPGISPRTPSAGMGGTGPGTHGMDVSPSAIDPQSTWCCLGSPWALHPPALSPVALGIGTPCRHGSYCLGACPAAAARTLDPACLGCGQCLGRGMGLAPLLRGLNCTTAPVGTGAGSAWGGGRGGTAWQGGSWAWCQPGAAPSTHRGLSPPPLALYLIAVGLRKGGWGGKGLCPGWGQWEGTLGGGHPFPASGRRIAVWGY